MAAKCSDKIISNSWLVRTRRWKSLARYAEHWKCLRLMVQVYKRLYRVIIMLRAIATQYVCKIRAIHLTSLLDKPTFGKSISWKRKFNNVFYARQVIIQILYA